jgi:hypothetical protein
MKIYDPSSGWKYGFPKEYKPIEGETLEQTLVRDGYPSSEFDQEGKVYWVRFWEVSDDSYT